MDRSFAAEEAYEEFIRELKGLHSGGTYEIAKVDRRFHAYVMEFRLYLDHWIKHIADIKKLDEQYGAIYEKLYNDVTNREYDNCEEYVLATVIRNYVVHGYDAINHSHIDGYNNQVFIDRDALEKINISKSGCCN